MLRATIIVMAILVSSLAMAQSSVPRLMKIANEHYEAAQYTEAIEFYSRVVKLNKISGEARYKLAMSLYRTLQYDRAKKHYRFLFENQYPDYKHLANYYLGNILKLSSSFEVADTVFAHLLKQPGVPDEILELAKKQQEGCQLAINQKKQNRGFRISEMKEFNSEYHDFGAVMNKAGGTMVFVSTRNTGKSQFDAIQYEGLLPDLLQFSMKGDKWRNSTSKDGFDKFNTQWSEGSGSFTADGQYFYFTSCRSNDGADCKIMVSKLEGDKWREPQALNDFINMPGVENKHPYITQGGDTLFFVSDRPGGIGGSDIWMSLQGYDEGSWTPAINLGDIINTASNEITPFYSSKFSCLLFASDGHVGYGGYDIFAAKGESFFEPQIYNLGDPFNSALDDTYFYVTDSVGFIASNRIDKRNLDLYNFQVSDERLYLSLLISGESLIDERVVARYRDIRSLDLTTFRVEDYQGFEIFDPVKREKPKPSLLSNNPFGEEETETTTTVVASNTSSTSDQTTNTYRPEVSPEKNSSDYYSEQQYTSQFIAAEMKDIEGLNKSEFEKLYFDFGSKQLNYQTVISLHNLVDQLKTQSDPVNKIVIVSSTDNVGSSEYNLKLSLSRGDLIKRFLMARGLPEDLIEVSAHGENNLLSKNDTWYNHVFNRRAEIHVYSEGNIVLNTARLLLVRQDISFVDALSALGITQKEFLSWNKLKGETLKKGQIIRVGKDISVVPIKYFLEESDIKYQFFPYVVQEGETVQSIVSKFGTPEELLMEINQLDGDLAAGDEIFVCRFNF